MTLPIDEIIQGDNVEVMAGWPDECIDLTITSPPYDPVDYDDNGNLITHSDKGLRQYNGYEWDFTAVARQLYRVTKQGGVCVWVVNDATVNGSETGSSFRQVLYFMGLGFNMETMIYQSSGVGAKGSNNTYWQAFEYMFVFLKGYPKTVNRIADRNNMNSGHTQSPSVDSIGRKRKRHQTIKRLGVRDNVWIYNSVNMRWNADGHPAAFPEKLAHDHILSWSNPGDIILDPFIGSGTTAKMAALSGRHFIGIDISEEYCDISRRRVAAVQQQPRLFSWDLQPATNGRTKEPT